MGEPMFAVSSWSCTFDRRRGPVRVLDVRFDHRKPDCIDMTVYVSRAGNVRVYVHKDGKSRRLK